MSEIQIGSQESVRDQETRLKAELARYAERAKLGSSMALAINDKWRYVYAGIREEYAKSALVTAKLEEQEDKRADLIVAKLERRQLDGEMSQKGVSVPGYDKDSQALGQIIKALRTVYKTPETSYKDADYQVAQDLFNARKAIIEKGS